MGERTTVDVTFRGVAVCEETIGYVRRCVRRLEQAVPSLDPLVLVTLERRRPGGPIHATVGAGAGFARGEDLDELLALSNAFAVLGDRLGGLLTIVKAKPGLRPRWIRDDAVPAAAVAAATERPQAG